MDTQNLIVRMVSLDQIIHPSHPASFVSDEDTSKEEGPPDYDDSVLAALGLYTLLGALLTFHVLQSSHQGLTALSGKNEVRGWPST